MPVPVNPCGRLAAGRLDRRWCAGAGLNTRRSRLVASWGEAWYDTVAEMVEVELTSIPIRALRESDYDESVRLREEAIKRLAGRIVFLPLDDPLFSSRRKRC
jgi:hypothetical protein